MYDSDGKITVFMMYLPHTNVLHITSGTFHVVAYPVNMQCNGLGSISATNFIITSITS